jgi:hypothetical protein
MCACCLPTAPPAGTPTACPTASTPGRDRKRLGLSARPSTLTSPRSRAVTSPSPRWRDGRQLTPSMPAPNYRYLHTYLCARPWRPTGFWDVEDPTLSRQSAERWRQGCQPYAPAALCSPDTLLFCFWYSVLLEAESTPGPSGARRFE